MKIVAIIEIEDCGPFVVIDADFLSIVKISYYYFIAFYCPYTGRAMTEEISEECALQLIKNGVRCVDSNYESGKKA